MICAPKLELSRTRFMRHVRYASFVDYSVYIVKLAQIPTFAGRDQLIQEIISLVRVKDHMHNHGFVDVMTLLIRYQMEIVAS